MIWKDFSKKFRDGEHAFLGASNHAWYNYDDEKLVRIYINKLAASRGTAMHALACSLIKLKVKLPENGSTLSLYVNDAIKLGLRPEEKLFYSKFAYGTADGIDFKDGILRVSDLKTGKTKVSFLQLMIYAAYFCLEYRVKPGEIDIELRVYKNDKVLVHKPTAEDILPIMDKIVHLDKLLESIEGKEV